MDFNKKHPQEGNDIRTGNDRITRVSATAECSYMKENITLTQIVSQHRIRFRVIYPWGEVDSIQTELFYCQISRPLTRESLSRPERERACAQQGPLSS